MACTSCFAGEIQDEKPTGNVINLYGREIYVAEPPEGVSPKGIIIMISDAFGWSFVNYRILADKYAKNGHFRVFLPDFMDGTAAPVWMISTLHELLKGDSLWAWLTKPYHIACTIYGIGPWVYHNNMKTSTPKVQDFFTSARHENPSVPIGAAAYCWGGKHTVDLASGVEANGKPLIDGGFTAHPSRLVLPTDIEKVKKPLSIAIGDKDSVISIAQAKQTQDVLKGMGDVKSEVVVYPGAGHGFSVRAELGNEKLVEQAAKAEAQAIECFTECFN